MRHLPLSFAAALALAAACQAPPKVPTEATPPEAAPPEAVEAVRAPASASTVCAAYSRQLEAASTALANAPDNAGLQEQVATYQSIISDACS